MHQGLMISMKQGCACRINTGHDYRGRFCSRSQRDARLQDFFALKELHTRVMCQVIAALHCILCAHFHSPLRTSGW